MEDTAEGKMPAHPATSEREKIPKLSPSPSRMTRQKVPILKSSEPHEKLPKAVTAKNEAIILGCV